MSDRENNALTALLEEFRARWEHFLNLDNEVNKWTASYAIGLVVAISWILGSDRFDSLASLFTGRNYDNSYFLLSLALVNAAYILSLAFKGYQIQQICLYLCTEIGARVEEITREPFNLWEVWRRTHFNKDEDKGKPEWRRRLYYPTVTFLPFLASGSILWLYVEHVSSRLELFDRHNLYFAFVLLINIFGGVLSFSTIALNREWVTIISQLHRTQLQTQKQVAAKDSPAGPQGGAVMPMEQATPKMIDASHSPHR